MPAVSPSSEWMDLMKGVMLEMSAIVSFMASITLINTQLIHLYSSSFTNQNAPVVIDHQLEFIKQAYTARDIDGVYVCML